MEKAVDHARFEKIASNIFKKVKESLIELNQIWDDLGIIESSKQSRLLRFEENIEDILKSMKAEEEDLKTQIIERIEAQLEEMSDICLKLGIKLPKIHDKDAPLYQIEKAIRKDLKSLQTIKNERLQKYAELKRQEEELTCSLGLRCRSPFLNEIPSEEQLLELEEYVQQKTNEKLHLDAIFRETRQAICAIMKELDTEPKLEFEKVVVDCPEQFRPTKENMAKLKVHHQSLEQQVERARRLATELREKLSYLWERLQVSPETRAAFLDANPGCTLYTIEALKVELKRCEALKAANIAMFVRQLRAELEDWWDKCFFSDEQRHAFAAYFSEDYTEDLLDIHEVEVTNMRQFYEEHVDIFQLVLQRQKVWEKMRELESFAKDKNRYTNRGGQLLKEEKARRAIQKELPKIEEELRSRLVQYQETNGKPFLINGANFLEIVIDEWDQHIEKKEKEKIQRKITRDQVDARPNLTKNVTSRNITCTPTPLKMTRTPLVMKSAPPKVLAGSNLINRKRNAATPTPQDHVSTKKSKTASKGGDKSGPRLSVSRVRRFGKHSPHYQDVLNSTRHAKESRHGVQAAPKSRRNIMPTINQQVDIADSSIATSYSDFQEQLEMLSAEKTCRSSVVPQHYLRERNARSPANGCSRPLGVVKGPDTPGRVHRSGGVHKQANMTSVYTPRKTPVASTTPARVRSALRSPAVTRSSPLSSTKTRLTTARGRLPIII